MKKSSKKHYLLNAESGKFDVLSESRSIAPLDRTEEYLIAVVKAATQNIWIKLQGNYRKQYFEFLERITLQRRYFHTPQKALVHSAEQFLKRAHNAAKHAVKQQYGMAQDYKKAAKLLASKQKHSYDDLEKILPIGKHQLYAWVKNGRLKKEEDGRFLVNSILDAVSNNKYDQLKFEYEELIKKGETKAWRK